MSKENIKQTKNTGIVVRSDLSILVWSGDTAIEVQLSVKQMQELSEHLKVCAFNFSHKSSDNDNN